MLTKLEIENFKSIYKESIELGRVNVFIGENGCGKTNVLEALGIMSAVFAKKLGNDELALKGIRVTKPSITFSSFQQQKQENSIKVQAISHISKTVSSVLVSELIANNESDIFSTWIDNMWAHEINNPNKRLERYKDFAERSIGLNSYKIYQLSTQILRGISPISREIPGIHGENLDLLISTFSKTQREELLEYSYFISWLEDIILDKEDRLKFEGHKLDMSTSILYFKDRFMQRKNNVFSAENANEGVLHILFYLALFISEKTPKLFAIDNIETALNPQLCRDLMMALVKLAKKHDKQVLITTHNPAILDGLNLHDDEQRLFTVSRNNKGHTKIERLRLKPKQEVNGRQLKLSELWMRGHLGAIPHF